MTDMSEIYGQFAGKSGHVKPEDGKRVIVYGPRGQLKEVKVRLTSLAVGPGAGICYWDETHKRVMIQADLTDLADDGFPFWGFYDQLCRATGELEYYNKAKRYFERLANAKANGLPRPLTPQVKGPPSKKDKHGEGSHYAYRPTPDDWYHPVLEKRRKGHVGSAPIVEWSDFEVEVDTSGEIPRVNVKQSEDALDDFASVGRDA